MSAKLMTTRTFFLRTGVVLLVAAASASCGDVVNGSRAPLILTVNSLQAAPGSTPDKFGGTLDSDVLTNVTSPDPCTATAPCPTIFGDLGTAILSASMKDVNISPTANNGITITRYHVNYRRSDGRNTPGVDVPFGWDGAATATIAPGGTASIGFEIVRHVAKAESPLVQLRSVPNIISTIADVTFYGRDQVGNDVTVTAFILINFGNFGDTK